MTKPKILKSDKTRVKFRMWRVPGGEETLIALFPDLNYRTRQTTAPGLCMSYEHVGQHGEADYNMIMKRSRPATKAEYEPLLRELEMLGYDLDVH